MRICNAGARQELSSIFTLAWPVCSCQLLFFFLQFVNMLGAGRMGTQTLASVALGNSYFNIASYFVMGAATSIDTLVSQAAGRGDHRECKVWLLRSLLVFSCAAMPLCGLMMLSGHIFEWLGVAAVIARPAAVYVWRLVPGIPFFVLFVCLQKYQQSMNILAPSLCTLLLGTVVNLLATMWAISTSEIACMAWVWTCVRIFLFLCMAVIVPKTSPGFTSISFSVVEKDPYLHLWQWEEMSKFLRMCFSGAFMMGLEAMAFEITVFGAAACGKLALDAHNILLQIISLFYLSVPLGISIASTIRVGNLLGFGNGNQAKFSAHLCIGIGTAFMLCSGTYLLVLRFSLGYLFTTDMRVAGLVAKVAPVAAFFQVIDGFQGVCGGVMRAMGQQTYLAVSIFTAFYCISLPAGFWLCFGAGCGIFGLWVGLAIGLSLMAFSFGYRVFWSTSWTHEAQIASAPRSELADSLL